MQVAGTAAVMPAGRATLLIVGCCLLLAGCAALDEHAVAETYRLDDAPYYVALAQPQPDRGACAIVLPVRVDPVLGDTFGYSDRAQEFGPLVDALNERLATRTGCIRPVSHVPAAGAPRVYVGTAESEYAPPEVVDQRLASDRFAPMVLHLQRPSAEWQQQAAALASGQGASYVIAIQLGVSQYAKGYSGVVSKEVALGTGYRQPIKFLTAEDKPVEVLHLTGVLVDATGRAIRAGAEGVVLRDTPFLAQTVDASRMFDPDELQRVLDRERRTDLPGAPLKLEVALDNLLAQLTLGEVRVPAK